MPPSPSGCTAQPPAAAAPGAAARSSGAVSGILCTQSKPQRSRRTLEEALLKMKR